MAIVLDTFDKQICPMVTKNQQTGSRIRSMLPPAKTGSMA